MKQPTAPNLYPDLSNEDGQNYRLHKISEIEQKLINEKDTRRTLCKKYKRAINITDGIDSALISSSVVMAGVGIAFPFMLPLGIAAIVSGGLGVFVKLIRRRLQSKAKKHNAVETIAESKLNSITDLISKALSDGQISDNEFKMVLDELTKYNDLKDKTRLKHTGLSEQEKDKLIQEGKEQALSAIQKNIKNV